MIKTYTLKEASDKLGIAQSTLNDRVNMMESVIFARENGKRCINENELNVLSYLDEQMKSQSGKKDLRLACEETKETFYTAVNMKELKRKLKEVNEMTQEIIDSLK
ncbi:hypothetical protein ACWV26_17700 [Rummeliibacillus sp. JY-2-4R]